MKSLFAILIISMMPMALSAENYFQNGMTWENKSIGGAPEFTINYNNIFLEGDTIVDNYQATKMYYNDKDNFLAFIRTDGDKVYFKYDYPEEDWYLFYDFGLKEGDECYIYRISTHPQTDRRHTPFYMKCRSVQESSRYPGWTEMILDNDASLTEPDPILQEPYYCVWLKGLGSLDDILAGDIFNAGIAGGAYSLIKATFNGNVIFEYKTTNTRHIESIDTQSTIFSLDGRKIYEGSLNGNGISSLIDRSGIYILKSGNRTKKIIISK